MSQARTLVLQLLSFGLVGVVNTLVGFAAILALLAAGVGPFPANAGGFAAGLVVSFTLNKRFTFGLAQGGTGAAHRFLVAFAIAYGLNLGMLFAGERLLALGRVPSQALGVAAYTCAFFLLCRQFVFRASASARAI
jgi:putative flippase GtrA